MAKKTKSKRKLATLRRARKVLAGLAGHRGPERSVTLEVVERVGKRVAIGMPIEYALALETHMITVDCFHKALQTDTKLSTHLAKFKAEYLERVLTKLAESDDLSHPRWLLPRRFPDIFALASEKAEAARDGEKVADGLQDLLNRSRELARLQQEGAT